LSVSAAKARLATNGVASIEPNSVRRLTPRRDGKVE
jgi:hypothetical protein